MNQILINEANMSKEIALSACNKIDDIIGCPAETIDNIDEYIFCNEVKCEECTGAQCWYEYFISKNYSDKRQKEDN